jgi:alpha-aminoadipic semialdehyde synthase
VYGKELLQNASPFIDEWPDLHLECLPNRDSLLYEKVYGIESASTIFRGTLRYRGFSRLMHIFQNMGLFETVAPIGDRTWGDVLKTLRMQRGGFEHLEDFLLACAEDDMDDAALASKCLVWLGMTGATKIKNPSGSVVDQFCDVLEQKLQYRAGERDMVVMYHAIGVEFEDGTKEQHKSSLQAFGTDSMSAMCKTVGYPTAAAASLILDGSLDSHRGLLLPTNKSVYVPILNAVEKEGIVFKESVSVETEFVKRRRVMPAM